MCADRRLSEFPEVLPAPAAYGGGSYRRDDAHAALPGTAGAAERGKGPARIVSIDAADPSGQVVAVYESPAGELVAPTGVLFVRMGEGSRAVDRAAELKALGLRIVSIPSFAPNTAYVEAAQGGVARTLRLVGKLSGLPGVEAVEVQMAREAQRK